MNKGNTIEDFFCKQFIKSGYQDRFFFELSSNKKRVKAISRICHNMMDIINENKIVEVYNSTDLIHLTVTIQNWRIDYHVSFPYLRAKLKT